MRNSITMMAVGILMVCLLPLAALAQQQDWQSTSAMQGAGSNYAPQVTAVGATGVSDMATTTESYSPAKAPSGPRRTIGNNQDGGTGDPGSPIGDALIPLSLMALAFAGYVALRRKRLTNE